MKYKIFTFLVMVCLAVSSVCGFFWENKIGYIVSDSDFQIVNSDHDALDNREDYYNNHPLYAQAIDDLNNTIQNINGTGGAGGFRTRNYLGANFTGSNGDVNRTLNLSAGEVIVNLERNTLIPSQDYLYNNNELTIYLPVFDIYKFSITEFNPNLFRELFYLGSDLNGTETNRTLQLTYEPFLISLERQQLIKDLDFVFNETTKVVEFNVYITDDMRLSVWERILD